MKSTPPKRIVWYLVVGGVLGGIVGLLLGPFLGTLITRGDPSTLVGKQGGFTGFIYGLYIGPPLGVLVGLLGGWRCYRRSRKEPSE